jgi:hypothetical protein
VRDGDDLGMARLVGEPLDFVRGFGDDLSAMRASERQLSRRRADFRELDTASHHELIDPLDFDLLLHDFPPILSYRCA